MSETSPDRQPPHQASTLLGAMALADAPHRLTDPQTFSAPSATTWDPEELIAHSPPTLAAALRLLWADQGKAALLVPWPLMGRRVTVRLAAPGCPRTGAEGPPAGRLHPAGHS
jgi:hypothetical protein